MKKVLMFTIADWLLDPDIINGEREYMYRLLKALKNLNADYIITDRYGNVYDYENKTLTGKTYADYDVTAMFCNHYTEYPFLDVYTMMALWNPLLYLVHIELSPHHQDYLPERTLKQYDAYESYDDWKTPSPLQSDVFNKYVGNDKARFDNYPLYLPSVSKSDILPPAEKFEKIFYVGVGWEMFIPGKPKRHAYELSNLSDLGLMNIYGPFGCWRERANEVNYMGEIPADGETIFKTIRESGITLALASEEHISSDIATNRVFEGIAAGSIVISNIRGQIYDMFGDNVLYIDANQNEEQRLQQIVEHQKWIVANQDKVSEMVSNTQQILSEKYCLEALISDLLTGLETRKTALKNSREIAVANAPKIDIVYLCPDDENAIKSDLGEIFKQNYPNINLHVFTEKHKSLIENIKQNIGGNCQINIINEYYDNKSYHNVFNYLYNQNNIDLTTVFTTGSKWKHNFLSIMAKLLLDNPEKQVALAKSSIYQKNTETRFGVRDTYEYNDIRYYDYRELYADVQNRFLNISSTLFKLSYFKDKLAPTNWGFIDGLSGLYITMSALHNDKLINSQYILTSIDKNIVDNYLQNLTQENIFLMEYSLPEQLRQFSNSEQQVIVAQPNAKEIIQTHSREQYVEYKNK